MSFYLLNYLQNISFVLNHQAAFLKNTVTLWSLGESLAFYNVCNTSFLTVGGSVDMLLQ